MDYQNPFQAGFRAKYGMGTALGIISDGTCEWMNSFLFCSVPYHQTLVPWYPFETGDLTEVLTWYLEAMFGANRVQLSPSKKELFPFCFS